VVLIFFFKFAVVLISYIKIPVISLLYDIFYKTDIILSCNILSFSSNNERIQLPYLKAIVDETY